VVERNFAVMGTIIKVIRREAMNSDGSEDRPVWQCNLM
jgi:hypothetical protein